MRTFLVVVSILLVTLVIPSVYERVWTILDELAGGEKITAYPWNDSTREIMSARIALSATLFQSALVLLAAMWGLLIVKKSEAAITFAHGHERVLLLLATVSLILSCVAHVSFIQDMTRLAMHASITKRIPDLAHRDVSYMLLSQCTALIGGGCIAAATVISASWLRRADG